jgi:hypothetical protein
MASCEVLNPQALHKFSQWTVDPEGGMFVVPVRFSPQRSVYDVTRRPTPYPSSSPSPRLEVIEDDFRQDSISTFFPIKTTMVASDSHYQSYACGHDWLSGTSRPGHIGYLRHVCGVVLDHPLLSVSIV